MYQINNEKFGQFLAEVRKEKQMTQKDLADKLFVSDKTVSKWERGNSMPNVTLLIPIADILGITVTELLQGEKLKENKTLNSDVVETLVVNSLDLSLRDTIHQRKKELDICISYLNRCGSYRGNIINCFWNFHRTNGR